LQQNAGVASDYNPTGGKKFVWQEEQFFLSNPNYKN